MAVAWTRHRFSGGTLALDTANTVVLRGDPLRSFDRFADPAEIARFAEAASRYRGDELAGSRLSVADPTSARAPVLAIRETTDRLFRAAAGTGQLDAALMPPFLRACAAGFDRGEAVTGPGGGRAPVRFEAALARSALTLLERTVLPRIRVCPNCRWLFLDRSRNGSRLWCDMAVCGNRVKARRHYRRRHDDKGESSHG